VHAIPGIDKTVPVIEEDILAKDGAVPEKDNAL
jgi:hypothetical protein